MNMEKTRDYTDSPSNVQTIQNALSVRCKKSTATGGVRLRKSSYRGRPLFNGFFFGVNMDRVRPSAFDGNNLFNPANLVVGQEDDLQQRLKKNGDVPMISQCAFVFHYKSITAPYFAGQNRNDLKKYHVSLRGKDLKLKDFPHLYNEYGEKIADYVPSVYPYITPTLVIAMAISDPAKNPKAGDIYTARELAAALTSLYNVEIRYLHRLVWLNFKSYSIKSNGCNFPVEDEIGMICPRLMSFLYFWMHMS